jgi:hypothetical protein
VFKISLAALVVAFLLLWAFGPGEDDRIGARDTAPAGVEAVELVSECGDRPRPRCNPPR